MKKRATQRIIRIPVWLLAGCLTAGAQTPKDIQGSLDSFILKGMKDWQVPGLALTIVKDGKVVKMAGYGERNTASHEPVNEHTRFFIASNSKLFTGTVLAHLEQQGKLNLNHRVTQYLPDFRLYDPVSTSLLSIRDLLSHRIGTKTFQGDFTFWNTNLSRQEILKSMQLLKPSGIFRQDYGYCNSCFMAAGEIVPAVTGISWEQYVQDSILQKLGMRESFAASNGIEKRVSNMATPYTTSYSGTLRQVPYDHWDNLGPAASIVSNVSDLSRWLLFQLDSGRLEGKQLFPWATLQKTRQINVITGSFKSALYPIHFRGYGLGVFAADYNGRQIYWHTGGAAGMVSNVCFVPEEKLGIAILTNNDNQEFFEALRYQLLDAYLGVTGKNRSAELLPGFRKEMQAQLRDISNWRSRVKGNIPPLPLKSYCGTFTHELYGRIFIKEDGNKLLVSFEHHPDMTALLSFMDGNEWLLEYSNIEYGVFSTTFSVQHEKVTGLSVPMNPFVELDAYNFIKK